MTFFPTALSNSSLTESTGQIELCKTNQLVQVFALFTYNRVQWDNSCKQAGGGEWGVRAGRLARNQCNNLENFAVKCYNKISFTARTLVVKLKVDAVSWSKPIRLRHALSVCKINRACQVWLVCDLDIGKISRKQPRLHGIATINTTRNA